MALNLDKNNTLEIVTNNFVNGRVFDFNYHLAFFNCVAYVRVSDFEKVVEDYLKESGVRPLSGRGDVALNTYVTKDNVKLYETKEAARVVEKIVNSLRTVEDALKLNVKRSEADFEAHEHILDVRQRLDGFRYEMEMAYENKSKIILEWFTDVRCVYDLDTIADWIELLKSTGMTIDEIRAHLAKKEADTGSLFEKTRWDETFEAKCFLARHWVLEKVVRIFNENTDVDSAVAEIRKERNDFIERFDVCTTS